MGSPPAIAVSWLGLQPFECSPGLDIQDGAFTWLVVNARCQLEAQLCCRPERLVVSGGGFPSENQVETAWQLVTYPQTLHCVTSAVVH